MTNRRKLLASIGTVGTVAIAGCNSVRIPYVNDDEFYPTDITNELLLREEDFPRLWSYDGKESFGNGEMLFFSKDNVTIPALSDVEFRGRYASNNKPTGTYVVGVSIISISNTIWGAESVFDEWAGDLQNKNIDIANEARSGRDQGGSWTYFRHVNAVGCVTSLFNTPIGDYEGNATSLSQKYAKEMFSKWQDVYPIADSE